MAVAKRARLTLDARRDQLLRLGIEIFSRRPFDDVSIDDIAAAAGISKGLLYHYFPSKREFYVGVVRFSAEEMATVTEVDPALAPLARLRDGLDRYLAYVETHAAGYSTVLRAGIGCDPEVAAIVEESRDALVERVMTALPGKDGASAAAQRTAVRGWIGFAEAASLDWLEHRAMDAAALRDLLVAVLLAALQPPVGRG
jgi:AcrR family transcriptional regulator